MRGAIQSSNYKDIRNRIKKYDKYVAPTRRYTSQDIVKINEDVAYTHKPYKSSNEINATTQPNISRDISSNTNRGHRRLKVCKKKSESIALAAVIRSTGQQSLTQHHQFVAVPAIPKRRFWKTAVNVVGIAVFIFATGVSVQTFLINSQAKEQVAVLADQETRDAQGVAEGTGDNPSESSVDETAFWSYKPINPEHPRYLRIPELSVFARVKSLGLTNEGAVDSPKNINDVGWYNKGAIPGSATGSSLLLGHVSGWTADGIFKKLPQMREGMRFSVEKGSGQVIDYEVYRTAMFALDEVDMQAILNADTPGVHDLKLMTCAGKFDSTRNTFVDRFVVYAKRVN